MLQYMQLKTVHFIILVSFRYIKVYFSLVHFRSEIWILLKKSSLLSIVESLLFTSSIIATYIAVVILLVTGQALSPSTAFVVLSFMNLLRVTLSIRISNAMPLVFELFVSFKRIERFLLLSNMPLDPLEYDQTSCGHENIVENKKSYAQLLVRKPLLKTKPTAQKRIPRSQDGADHEYEHGKRVMLPEKANMHLSVSGLTYKLKEHKNGEKYLLQDVTFEASERSLTAITGQVGSGKSTLLAAIAGEVVKSSGNVFCSGTIAYVPQTAWVFPGTLRENVLFGEPYDEKKYTEVIEACALKEDINRFSNGDLTFVGEHGVVLSGGQRARVNLARAVYADVDVYLLDDPLSAVDAKVGEHIFEKCICKLLREKITILATYAENNMKAAHQVVVLHKGSVLGKGSFFELQTGRKVLDTILGASATNHEETTIPKVIDENETAHVDSSPVSDSFVEHLEVSEEDKATGNISYALYWDYFRAGNHPVVIVAIAVLFLVSQG